MDDAPSIGDLNRITEGLPDGCVEAFTTSIQPMLMNHCSTAGCHGPQSPTPLKLLRISAGRAPSRRATQRKRTWCCPALRSIAKRSPDDSLLLTIPTRPHGNVKSAIFSTRETNQYRQLVAWAYQVANQPMPEGMGATSELPGPTARRVARRQQSHKGPRVANDSSPDGTETKAPAACARPPTSACCRFERGRRDRPKLTAAPTKSICSIQQCSTSAIIRLTSQSKLTGGECSEKIVIAGQQPRPGGQFCRWHPMGRFDFGRDWARASPRRAIRPTTRKVRPARR